MASPTSGSDSEHPTAARIRAAFEAFAAEDYASAAAVLDEHCHYRVNGRSRISGTYVGRDAIVGLFRRIEELTGGTFNTSPFEIFANDSDAVALIDVTAERGGESIAYSLVIVAHLEDDAIVEMWSITDDPYRVDPFWDA